MRAGPIRVNMYDNPLYRVVFTKAVWAAWRIALPLLLWGVPLSTYIALFIIAELASGYWLAFNFQVRYSRCSTPCRGTGSPQLAGACALVRFCDFVQFPAACT